MQKRQRNMLIKFAFVMTVTVVAVIAMMNFKTWVNRTEGMRAMEHLGKIILEHKVEHGTVPSEFALDRNRESLSDLARLGNLHYRARWINFDSSPDEILAYSWRGPGSFFFSDSFIVMRLDGRIEWMSKGQFEPLLAKQQSSAEIQMLKKK